MFCEFCGMAIEDGSNFCDNCGKEAVSGPRHSSDKGSGATSFDFMEAWHSKSSKIGWAVAVVVVCTLGLVLYSSYAQTQAEIRQTAAELRAAQSRLTDIASSTSQKFLAEEQELSAKDSEIQKLKTDQSSGGMTSHLLASLAPSVVYVVCASDSYSGDMQAGSGVLYHSSSGSPADYFVETNLHVVQTSDGSKSHCAVAVYPNYADTSTYWLYETSGYQIYQYGADFAYIFPNIESATSHAGTMADLERYAKEESPQTYCSSVSIGDHVSVLGYPSVGGSSLTVTDGIVSGFEDDSGVNYVKTSAKIEHGNSGGVAVEDSGCVLGIPTFVEAGSIESIGRILDLHDLFGGRDQAFLWTRGGSNS